MSKPKMTSPETIQAKIMQVLQETPAGKSICPTQVAKILNPKDENWGRQTKNVRREAIKMAIEGKVTVLRKGKPTDPTEEIKGVIRLSLPVNDTASE